MLLVLVALLVAFAVGYLIGTPTVAPGVQGDGLTPEQRVRLWLVEKLVRPDLGYNTAQTVIPALSEIVISGRPAP